MSNREYPNVKRVRVSAKDWILIILTVTTVVLMCLGSKGAKAQTRERLGMIYYSQVGVRELTGNNDGPAVEKYLRTVGLGKGYSWCAAFVKWCFMENKMFLPINGMASSTVNYADICYQYRKFNKEPQHGDVMVLYEASLHRIGHTGFYNRRLNDRFFESVEGNTNLNGSRNGNGVYVKKRSFHATYIISNWFK